MKIFYTIVFAFLWTMLLTGMGDTLSVVEVGHSASSFQKESDSNSFNWFHIQNKKKLITQIQSEFKKSFLHIPKKISLIDEFKKDFVEYARVVDAVTNFEDYLFELAFEKGNLRVAQWFLQHADEIEFRGTITSFKQYFGECDFTKNVDSIPNLEDYLFELAFEKGNLSFAHWFLQNGCNTHKMYKKEYKNYRDTSRAPLIAAIENGHLPVVSLLLARGANPNGVKCHLQ